MSVLLSLLPLLQDDPTALIERLSSESAEQRDEAERAILNLGAPALPLLEKATKSRDSETSARAARLLRVYANRQHLTPRLRTVFPQLDQRMDLKDFPAWTKLFLQVCGMTAIDPSATRVTTASVAFKIGITGKAHRIAQDPQTECSGSARCGLPAPVLELVEGLADVQSLAAEGQCS
ncbi:MAG TPA: hypothetical protein VKW04_17620 [Planctomycetota bacterium]|nr:hypothetical protein [Planctomycetota bacterium]